MVLERNHFEAQVKETTEAVTVFVRGELDLAVAPQFRSVLEPLIPSAKPLVLNLSELTYIDSTGMGIIIFILKARAEGKAGFTLDEVPAKIKKLFDLTGISKFLTVRNSTNLAKADGA
ncbi:STAS domain-containing protein [Gorillibacterium massiliense]|uniref:STAS domain-containing protein n=1 Tax=Gorillibacterium massiliense TaxID=1280390 RepID=UPI0004BB32BD|nr:STAS domain-containing protein [Gorillibacterium massiliense]